MKAVRLVHPSNARTVISEDDAARLRQSGWVELRNPKVVSKDAEAQRRFRKRCRESGLKQLEVWLPPEAFAAIEAMRKPGETLTELITRLLCSSSEKSGKSHRISNYDRTDSGSSSDLI